MVHMFFRGLVPLRGLGKEPSMRALGLIVLFAVLGPLGTAGASEVVVYTARHYGQEPALEAFTKKTGIQVKLLAGSTGELFERLKAEGDRTPADVLLTVDAGNLWNAAQAGLLSQIDSPELASNVPASLRDPVRARTIMYNTSKVKPAELSCWCYVKMSWGNCSVKVSCPHGDFHDEPEGIAPSGLGQSRARRAHHELPSGHRPASHGPAGPTPETTLRGRRGPGAAPRQPGTALAASLAGEALRRDYGAHDDHLCGL